MVNKKKIIFAIIVLVLLLGGGYYLIQQGHFEKNISTNNITDVNNGENIKLLDYEKGAQEILLLGKKWFLNNIQEDGSFVYLYDQDGNIKNKNNAIRQLLAFRVVAQLCQQGERQFCQLHKRNLDFVFSNWYKTENKNDKKIGYILYNDTSKLGANALFLRVLLNSPYFEEYQKSAQEVFAGIKYLQNKDGSFRALLVGEKNLNREKYLLKFYSGEAILSLLEYYEKIGDENIYQVAKKSQEYYVNEYVKNMNYNYYPAYVPWQTFSLFKFYQKTKEKKYAQAIFILNDELIKIQDQYNYKGRFYDFRRPEYGRPHSSSDAIYGESLVTAYLLAKELNDTQRQKKYFSAIKMDLFNLAKLQFCNSRNKIKAPTQEMCGGLQIRAGEKFSRVDSLAHTFDFLFSLYAQNLLK
jgi:hypothetical protein